MNQPFAAEGIQRLSVDASNPAIVKAGRLVTEALMEKCGIEQGMGIAIAALAVFLMTVLHNPSPMPETNIASLRRIVKSLGEIIDDHEECAKKLSSPVVSEDEDDEPAKPTVH